MNIEDLVERHKGSREDQIKAIFACLFIVGNKLQTMFDKEYPEITLKQFMLLIMLHQAKEQLTFTQLGTLMGCSRQNVKKLAAALEQKGFVQLGHSEQDMRASVILPTEKLLGYFQQAADQHRKKLEEIFCGYRDGEIEEFFTLLTSLHRRVDTLEHNEKISEDTV